jgi:hypothetical protein
MTFAAGAAAAANVANWSYAEAGVGSCDAATCNASHPAIYVTRHNDQGFNHNASISVSDTTRGSASAWVGLDDFPSLPDLHAIASGKPDALGAKSWNFGFTEAIVGFRWTGADVSIPFDTFVGTLNFSNTGAWFGQAIGSFAVVNNVIDDPAVGALWTADSGNGGFAATCSTVGAETIMTTGLITTKGLHQVDLTHDVCPMPTLNLVHNENFYFVSRLETFAFGNEVVDASGTFTIDFKAGTSEVLQRYLAANIAPSVTPEPSSWALMLMGFMALGAAVRSRRRAAA